MKLIIKLITRQTDGSKEELVIVGTSSSNKTSDLKKLWDAEHIINDYNGYLRCHIEVTE